MNTASENNIILSGGWGFGNLGDDAICLATVRLLHHKYPQATITIESFNINEIRDLFADFPYIILQESIYKTLFKKYKPIEEADFLKSKSRYVIDKINSLIRRHINKAMKPTHKDTSLINGILSDTEGFINSKDRKVFHDYIETCKRSFLYVMSGGHLLNGWTESLASKYLEVYIAKNSNIRCVIMGQTIGAFPSKPHQMMAKRLLNDVEILSVRDTSSISEMECMEIRSQIPVIPDIALTESYVGSETADIIYIPFKLGVKNFLYFREQLHKLSIANNNATIKIAVSQLWDGTLQIASRLYIALRELGVKTKMIVPNDVDDLQKEIASSSLVLSENLHGLILAYRSGRKVVCLNKNKKFISFMEQIKSSAIDDINTMKGENTLIQLSRKAKEEQVPGKFCFDFQGLYNQYYKLLPEY